MTTKNTTTAVFAAIVVLGVIPAFLLWLFSPLYMPAPTFDEVSPEEDAGGYIEKEDMPELGPMPPKPEWAVDNCWACRGDGWLVLAWTESRGHVNEWTPCSACQDTRFPDQTGDITVAQAGLRIEKIGQELLEISADGTVEDLPDRIARLHYELTRLEAIVAGEPDPEFYEE